LLHFWNKLRVVVSLHRARADSHLGTEAQVDETQRLNFLSHSARDVFTSQTIMGKQPFPPGIRFAAGKLLAHFQDACIEVLLRNWNHAENGTLTRNRVAIPKAVQGSDLVLRGASILPALGEVMEARLLLNVAAGDRMAFDRCDDAVQGLPGV